MEHPEKPVPVETLLQGSQGIQGAHGLQGAQGLQGIICCVPQRQGAPPLNFRQWCRLQPTQIATRAASIRSLFMA